MAVDREQRTRALRYKRPALASMGYEHIQRELEEIVEACDNVAWFAGDIDTLTDALDGSDEEAHEFMLACSDLSAKAGILLEQLYEVGEYDPEGSARQYDDCTVALIGNRYDTVGFDTLQEDYFSLTGYDTELAESEAGKRLMRHTKADMLSLIGQSVGILVAFLDIRQQYDYLQATLDVLRDENGSVLQAVKDLNAAYEKAEAVRFNDYKKEAQEFERLLWAVPERMWVE
ncbi:hypothetical protein [Acutalibacter sp. 1XD8-36]|uniref:hypothetical protein n=1 Tax=Acutalibacter sp. 1XD8-36 TaxID=2320852 RepID=UPI0013730273|nr:hypothetical protein [Acutalibacter sp. 1XD8-36]